MRSVTGVALLLGALRALPLAAQEGVPATCTAPRGTAPVIDSAQLLRDLSVLAADTMEGRRMGTPGAVRARAFLLQRMADVGLEPLPGGFEQPFGTDGGVNLVGVIPGTKPGPAIVLTAHYDHLGTRGGTIYNGADDNASGTAAVLAIASMLVKQRPAHPVIVALFDGEEAGLLGSRAFMRHPPVPADSMLLNINLDMVSRSDAGQLFAVGPGYLPSLVGLVEAAACTADVTLMLGHDKGSRDDWMPQSDQAPFHAAGVPFLYLGVEDHPDYHRPTDDVAAIDPGFFVRSVRAIASVVRAADAQPPAWWANPTTVPQGARTKTSSAP